MTDRIIFACDYEDTYSLDLGKHPKETEVAAVKAFRKAGNLFGIVCERDTFEALANMGEYEEEYDFLVCSTGGSLVVRLPITPGGYGAPTRICTDTANQYYLSELYDLFASMGTSRIGIDVLSFMGGDSEGARFASEYDGKIPCWVHYWGGGGVYRVFPVNRDALTVVTPFSQCSATFNSRNTASGLAAEINRRYYGKLHAYADGCTVCVIPAGANKATGVARFADLAGIPRENVWTFGNGVEDARMLREFNGIAMAEAHPAALAATDRRAASVAEAIGIILSGK